ncbi:Holo-[acyl-carrier-protein] synthase [Geodia barretti]|uniref:L-aminoadipate-semialdehyde dehydrogenase-phosphopantetheinyl transferase n=2 Tax=Geodia barretti TaxID=519541 RepID=A0AA35T9Y6_GEOBA|nr:Holo-[acyl-carrier-protein] synthase [Geodia barretti]
MLGTGVDLIEIERVAGVLERHGERFLRRVFTPGEIAYCRGRAPNLAARFAAKEAVMKSLGTGFRGVGWRDVEVVRAPSGAPSPRLHGRALRRAERLGVTEIAISLSHSRGFAVAFAVASRPDTVDSLAATSATLWGESTAPQAALPAAS